MKHSPSSFYSVPELCALLRIKKGTAWKWASDRKFPTVKIRGVLLFYADEINEAIDNGTKRSRNQLKQAA